MKGSKDINTIAATLNTEVDTVTGVHFGGYLGRSGMEPKVTSAIAAKKSTGLIGPIQGASGVYVVNIDNNIIGEKQDADNLRQRYENTSINALNYLMPVLQNRVKIVDNRLMYL